MLSSGQLGSADGFKAGKSLDHILLLERIMLQARRIQTGKNKIKCGVQNSVWEPLS